MNKRITRMVLVLALLLFALPTSAAYLTFVKVYKNGEVGIGNLAYVQSVAAGLDENGGLHEVSTGTAEPLKNPTNGHFYQLVAVNGSGMDWSEAQNAAATMVYNGMPGYLATVTSLQEEEFIVSNFPEIYPEYVWLGASDEASEGDWQWITGEAWDYTDWAIGEPNGGTYENCLEYGDYEPGWNDANCYYHETNFYLVEYSLIPITVPIDIT